MVHLRGIHGIIGGERAGADLTGSAPSVLLPLGRLHEVKHYVVGMLNKIVWTDGITRSGNTPSIGKLVTIAVLIAGLAAFFLAGLHHYVTPQGLKEHHDALLAWVQAHGAWSIIVFGIIYALAVTFSIPGGAVMTIAGGFLFGPAVATATVVVGATVGATTLFLLARYALADAVGRWTGSSLKKIENGFNEDGMSYMFVLRLVPLFPFWLVNLAPALLGVPLRTYIISTFFGIIPGTFVYALVGDGAGAVFQRGGDLDLYIIFEPRVLAPIIGFALLASIPILYKRWKASGRRDKI